MPVAWKIGKMYMAKTLIVMALFAYAKKMTPDLVVRSHVRRSEYLQFVVKYSFTPT